MPRRKVIPCADNVKDYPDGYPDDDQEISVAKAKDVISCNEITVKQEDLHVSESGDITLTVTHADGSQSNAEDEAQVGDKRNLSLEALFQAAHSELENISKEAVTTGNIPQGIKKQILNRVSSAKDQVKVTEVMAYLEVPPEMEKGTYIIHSGSGGETNIVGEVLGVEEPGHSSVSVPVPVSSNQVVQLVSSSEVASGLTENSPRITQTFVLGTPTENPAASKTVFVLKSATPVPDMKGITTVIGGGGRKRKHPQKPGKHICPYCNRGCAKPSVLKKHIRAHTGERPYPCTTCGFAFKTKSNLYKHHKSRWHLLKVGLATGKHQSSTGTDGDGDDTTSEEGDRQAATAGGDEQASQLPANIEIISDLLPDNTGPEQGTPPRKRDSREMSADQETETAVKNVRLQSGGLVIDRQASTELTSTVDACDKPTSQTVDGTSVSSSAQSASTRQGFELKALSERLLTSVTTVTRSATSAQTFVSHLNLPIKVTPYVTQTSTGRKPVEKSYSTNDLPDERRTQSKQKAAILHSRSLQTDTSSASGSTEKSGKNPKELLERISSLISANQEIISTSVAIPLRKRVPRQSSSGGGVAGQPASSVTGLSCAQSTSLAFQRTSSPGDKLLMVRNVTAEPRADMIRSLSVPAAGLGSPAAVQQESMLLVKQPVMQLPQGLLAPTSGLSTPKEIKIEFKLAKASEPQGPKTSDYLPSSGASGQNVNGQADVSRTQKTDSSRMTKDRPQLAAILQSSAPSLLQSQVQVEQKPGEHTYVCGSCWKCFQDVKVLNLHQEGGCPGYDGKPIGSAAVIQTATDEAKTSASAPKPKPAKLILTPNSELSGQANTAPPITVVTPPTPTERKKRGMLQRQKNVIIEMVDPLLSPKRGRPQGARSVSSTAARKPTLQRSQSTVETRSDVEEIPGELRGETPQALWKLKLKGRLLMKRSMSAERMLSQEREMEQNSERTLLVPPATKHTPLLRSKSHDGTVAVKQKPSRDIELRERILSKLSRSCHDLTRSDSAEVSDNDLKVEHLTSAPTEDLVVQDQRPAGAVHSEPARVDVGEVKPLVVSVPVKRAVDCCHQRKATFSPICLSRTLGSLPDGRVPDTLSIPVNIAHKVPGLLQEAKLKSPEEVSGRQSDGELDKEESSDVDEHKTSTVDSELGQRSRGAGQQTADTGTRRKNVCTLHTIQMAGPSRQVQERITITLLLLGHLYPSMKPSTVTTFCCIHKTQPTYVALGSQSKVSMYSNWRAAPYDPNPKGLASKQLLDLYQSQVYNCEPRYAMARSSSPGAQYELTQSSSKEKGMSSPKSETTDDIRLELFPDIRQAHLHDPVPQLKQQQQQTPKITAETAPEQPKETYLLTTTKDKLKETLTSEKVTKIRICEGGYKSTEDYVYVRGRGRGMYVCEKCGIRCKKPSMLKKHIRTHTDIRPYHCRYCNFSFKTKGNLTKHMKSKAHQKLCMDKGIIPVPTSVDEDCIISMMSESADDNDNGVIYEDIDGPTIGHTEEVSDHQFSDAEDPGHDEDEEEDEDIGRHETDAKESIDEVQLVEVEVVTNLPNDNVSDAEIKVAQADNNTITVISENQALKLGSQSVSLDKEIAAASLLDLSKVTNSDCNDSEEAKVKSQSDVDKDKENKPISKVVTADQSVTTQGSVTSKDVTFLSPCGYIHGQTTYARKIAMLKAANEHISAGFAPPIGLDNTELQGVPIQRQDKQANSKKTESTDLGPIVGQFIRPDVQIPTDKEESRQIARMHTASSIQKQILQLAKIPLSGQPCIVETKVRFVEGEGHAPREIIPVPIKTSDEVEQMDEMGRFLCQVCDKAFDKKHQLTLHRNIHMLEKPYKCEDCSLSFQSRMLLDKHQSSERHQQQVALMQQMGATTSEDPRPFKCEECNIAFRIHGHLARHLRSKMHISKLEALGRVPIGSYDQVDFNPSTMVVSASSVTMTTATMTTVTTAATSCSTSTRNHVVESGVVHILQKLSDLPSRLKVIKRTSLTGPEVETLIVKRPRLEKAHSEGILEELASAAKESDLIQSLPIRDSTFSYQTSDEYEKVDLASNDRVTVEIKSEPIEIGEIMPKVSQKRDDRDTDMETETEGLNADGPHKCGICGKTFKEISFLKHHLVSHAELRPYVCEYCDAGFTTALSLKYHLPMHAQEHPYLCGYCGSMFSKSEFLHHHLNKVHAKQSLEPTNQPASASHVIKSVDSVSAGLVTAASSSPTKLIGDAGSVSEPSQYVIQTADQSSPQHDQVVCVGASPKAGHGDKTQSQPRVGPSPAPKRQRTSSGLGATLVRQMALDTDNIPPPSEQKADVIEVDLKNCEVQECMEETADGEKRTVYMLVVPDNKTQGLELTGTANQLVTSHVQSGSRLSGQEAVVDRQPAECQCLLDAEVANMQTTNIRIDNADPAVKWKVIHMPDITMALSPIFDTEENADNQITDQKSS